MLISGCILNEDDAVIFDITFFPLFFIHLFSEWVYEVFYHFLFSYICLSLFFNS